VTSLLVKMHATHLFLVEMKSELVKFFCHVFLLIGECSSVNVGCDTGPLTCMLSLGVSKPLSSS
jgi:hypothetical protein